MTHRTMSERSYHRVTSRSLSRYRDANPVPTSPLADDIATAPLGPVYVIGVR